MSDTIIHTVGPWFAKKEIDALPASDKKQCSNLLKAQVSMSKQLEAVDAIDEKIKTLQAASEKYKTDTQKAPDLSIAERGGCVLGGIGAILLCPISWVAGSVVIGLSAAFVSFLGGKPSGNAESSVLGGMADFFYAGPVALVGGAFNAGSRHKTALETQSRTNRSQHIIFGAKANQGSRYRRRYEK